MVVALLGPANLKKGRRGRRREENIKGEEKRSIGRKNDTRNKQRRKCKEKDKERDKGDRKGDINRSGTYSTRNTTGK